MEQKKGPIVIFMLGGPGSGKGTQCNLLHDRYAFNHLSAGDLLRAQRKRVGSENGALIQKYIDEGKIVPSQITIGLLENAMRDIGWEEGRFLIDGFPRNQQNFTMWNKMVGNKVYTPFMIFLDCEEDIMLQRCLKRGQTSQRTDDNIEVFKKRIKIFKDETMQVVNTFKKQGKLVHVNSSNSVQFVFGKLKEALEKILTIK